MFGSDMLDVGIGTTLIFLFMSLIATALREAMEAILNTRARNLEIGLREILDDPDGTEMTKSIYDHPMIYALFLGNYETKFVKQGKRIDWWRGRHLPAYIPSAQFAEALLDRVAKGAVSTKPDLNVVWKQLTPDSLRASIALLPSAKLQRALGVALDQAQGDIEQVKANVEAWFDSAMDRVSGWYKTRSQVILFLLGLGAAVAFNVDAIEVVQRLTHDKDLRTAAVGYAERVIPSSDPSKAGQDNIPKALPAELQGATFAELRKQIDDIGYPIGWSPKIPQWEDQTCPSTSPGGCTRTPDMLIWTKMFLGWFITSLAVMLGAPFWFDVLNKFMIVRSTVKPREKSRDEGSKDGGGTSSGKGGDDDGPQPDGNGPDPVAVQGARASFALPVESPNPAAFVPHEWADRADKQEGLI